MPDKSMLHIVAIDDQPIMLKLMQYMLANLGYSQVTTCTSGQEGLDWLKGVDETQTIILLDLNMSEMDGIEFIRHLANRHYQGHILLLSAEDERIRETAHKLIKNYKIASLGHLQKPVTLELLSLKLAKWQSPQPKRVITSKKIILPMNYAQQSLILSSLFTINLKSMSKILKSWVLSP